MPKARENEEDQVLIDSSFGSDRLKKWRNFPGSIKERSKLKQPRTTMNFKFL